MTVVSDMRLLDNQDKLYFQVLINYIDGNNFNSNKVNKELETGAFKSLSDATFVAMKTANNFYQVFLSPI